MASQATQTTAKSNNNSVAGSNSPSPSLKKAKPTSSRTFGIPTDEILEEATLGADDTEVAGENTQELSDFTEQIEVQKGNTTKTSLVSTWARRISPLIQSKQVRAYSFINFFLTIINTFAFCVMIVSLAYLVLEIIASNAMHVVPRPCIFQWSEWSPCPVTCAESELVYPNRTRTVIFDSIIHPTEDFQKCPPDLEHLVDYAPCNTHVCPRNLSSFGWGRCQTAWQKCTGSAEYIKCIGNSTGTHHCEPKKTCNNCSQTRKLPEYDAMIYIDTPIMTQPCNCSGDNQPISKSGWFSGDYDDELMPNDTVSVMNDKKFVVVEDEAF